VFKNILVAVDGSQASTRALEAATDLAATHGGTLHILHVVREMQVPLTPGLMDAYEKLQRHRHEVLTSAGEQLINQAKRAVESKGVENVETDLGAGDPASAIIDYAARNKVDLIVMGHRGHSQVEHLLMGSVTRKVNNTAKTNCLVIR
jgi:nucleotide-binding universal stress UspA family protein